MVSSAVGPQCTALLLVNAAVARAVAGSGIGGCWAGGVRLSVAAEAAEAPGPGREERTCAGWARSRRLLPAQRCIQRPPPALACKRSRAGLPTLPGRLSVCPQLCLPARLTFRLSVCTRAPLFDVPLTTSPSLSRRCLHFLLLCFQVQVRGLLTCLLYTSDAADDPRVV